MSTLKELEHYYNSIIPAAVTLNSQFIFSKGEFNSNWAILEARKRLEAACQENNLNLALIRDGNDVVMTIKTQENELVLQLIMNFENYESEEE